MQPLRSISITETSSLLRVSPPLCLASVLSLLWDLHLSFSLIIETTGSHVPHKSLNQGPATFMPGAAQAVNRFPLNLSWRWVSHQFWRRPLIFDTSSMVRFRSAPWFIPATVLSRDFSLTLTTLALYQSSLRWFETCSCKPVPRGHTLIFRAVLHILRLFAFIARVAHLPK